MLLLLAVVTLLFPVWAISAAEQFGLRPDRQPSGTSRWVPNTSMLPRL